MKAFVVGVSAFLISSAAFAQNSPVAMGSAGASSVAEQVDEAQATADQEQSTDRRICRRVETATGSRMAYRRLCMTAEQWRNYNRTSTWDR